MRTALLTACFLMTVLVVCRNTASADELSKKQAIRSWGKIVADGKTLQLKVSSIPKNRKLDIPRFNNRLSSVWLKADSGRKPLKLVPQVTTWDVFLPKEVEASGADVIVEFKEPVSIGPAKAVQGKDGKVGLPAQLATTHGKLLRFEPQPHKNTVGYWANEKDWAEWSLEIGLTGDLELEVHQGCGKGQGGSTVEFELVPKGEKSGPKLTHTVVDTGHFQNFKPFKLGKFANVKEGNYSLRARCTKKAKNAVCDIRLIELHPAK